MNTSRRNFLKGAALTGAAAVAGGCMTNGGGFFSSVTGAPMHGYAAPKIPNIRLGVIGIGSRGNGVVGRACNLPGIEVVALCDISGGKIAVAQKNLIIVTPDKALDEDNF